jgi:hypothetical protein
MSDALAIGSDDALAMTHQPEGPNPVPPIVGSAANFASGGMQRALGLPNNFVGRALQNPDNFAAAPGLGILKWGNQALAPTRASSPRTWTSERVGALRKHVEEGNTLKSFEGGTNQNLTRASKLYGVESPGIYKGGRPKTHSAETVQRIDELRKLGHTQGEISEKTGLSVDQIKGILHGRIKAKMASQRVRPPSEWDKSLSTTTDLSLPRFELPAAPAEDINPAELQQFLKLFSVKDK